MCYFPFLKYCYLQQIRSEAVKNICIDSFGGTNYHSLIGYGCHGNGHTQVMQIQYFVQSQRVLINSNFHISSG
jgi:hypothetical protein